MTMNGIQGPQGYQGASLQLMPNADACTVPYSHMYLESNGDLMLYTGLGNSCFINVGNIKGPQGNDGNQGHQGYQGEIGYQGYQGRAGSSGEPGQTGERGYQGYQGKQGYRGYQGYQGREGNQGTQGYQGVGIRILGRVDNYNELPMYNNEPGDGYILDGNLFVWNGRWVDCGPIVGPQGFQGYQGSGTQGFQGRDGVQGYQGNRGYQGYQGEIGHGINVEGTVETQQELYNIIDPDVGDAWITEDNGHLWVYNEYGIWIDCGPIRGPQGNQGFQGYQGERGGEGTSVTTQDILVVGGPLADDSEDNWPDGEPWHDGNGNRIIPSGMSLDEVLILLFTKENWPTVTINYPWNDITANPTSNGFSIDNNNECERNKSISDPLEIGTNITLNGVEAANPSCTYTVSSNGLAGYYYKKDDIESSTEYHGNYSHSYTGSVSSNTKTLKIYPTGLTFSQTAYTNNIPIISGLIVAEGTNKVKIAQSGPTFIPYTPGENFTLYYSSNMHNYSISKYVQVDYDGHYNNKSKVASGSKTLPTINGYRKFFYGGYALDRISVPPSQIENWVNGLTSDKIRKGLNDNGLGLTHSTEAASNNYTFNYDVDEDVYNVLVVAVKSSFNITIYDTNQHKNIDESDGVIEKIVSVKANNNRDATNYKVWVFTANNLNNFLANTFVITFNN